MPSIVAPQKNKLTLEELKSWLDEDPKNINTPLHQLALHEYSPDEDAVTDLCGEAWFVLSKRSSRGWTASHIAAAVGNWKVLDLLIQENNNIYRVNNWSRIPGTTTFIEELNSDKKNALSLALNYYGTIEVVKLLLKANIKVNFQHLEEALKASDLSLFKFFKNKFGLDFLQQKNKAGKNLLSLAFSAGLFDAARTLLELGLSLKSLVTAGEGPLDLAIKLSNMELIEELSHFYCEDLPVEEKLCLKHMNNTAKNYLADPKDSSAITSLGEAYLYGEGLAKNPSEAAKYFKLAFKNKPASGEEFAIAHYNLGLCYKYGHGVDQAVHKAIEHFIIAAGKAYNVAQCHLGIYYYKNKDYVKGIEYSRIAAGKGNAHARNFLGLCHYFGWAGLKKEPDQGIYYFRLAAEQGFAEAQYNLATYYLKKQGAKLDHFAAIENYFLAAKQGYAKASTALKAYKDNETENNIWHLAVLKQDPELITYLAQDEKLKVLAEQHNKSGYSPLALAIRQKDINEEKIHTNTLIALLKSGVSLIASSKNGDSPLHIAVQAENLIAAQLLFETSSARYKEACIQELELNANDYVEVDQKNKAGETALHFAGKLRNKDMAQFLLDHNANPNVRSIFCFDSPYEKIEKDVSEKEILSVASSPAVHSPKSNSSIDSGSEQDNDIVSVPPSPAGSSLPSTPKEKVPAKIYKDDILELFNELEYSCAFLVLPEIRRIPVFILNNIIPEELFHFNEKKFNPEEIKENSAGILDSLKEHLGNSSYVIRDNSYNILYKNTLANDSQEVVDLACVQVEGVYYICSLNKISYKEAKENYQLQDEILERIESYRSRVAGQAAIEYIKENEAGSRIRAAYIYDGDNFLYYFDKYKRWTGAYLNEDQITAVKKYFKAETVKISKKELSENYFIYSTSLETADLQFLDKILPFEAHKVVSLNRDDKWTKYTKTCAYEALNGLNRWIVSPSKNAMGFINGPSRYEATLQQNKIGYYTSWVTFSLPTIGTFFAKSDYAAASVLVVSLGTLALNKVGSRAYSEYLAVENYKKRSYMLKNSMLVARTVLVDTPCLVYEIINPIGVVSRAVGLGLATTIHYANPFSVSTESLEAFIYQASSEWTRRSSQVRKKMALTNVAAGSASANTSIVPYTYQKRLTQIVWNARVGKWTEPYVDGLYKANHFIETYMDGFGKLLHLEYLASWEECSQNYIFNSYPVTNAMLCFEWAAPVTADAFTTIVRGQTAEVIEKFALEVMERFSLELGLDQQHEFRTIRNSQILDSWALISDQDAAQAELRNAPNKEAKKAMAARDRARATEAYKLTPQAIAYTAYEQSTAALVEIAGSTETDQAKIDKAIADYEEKKTVMLKANLLKMEQPFLQNAPKEKIFLRFKT